MSTPITLKCGAIHVWTLNNIVEGTKPNTNLGLRHAKTLILDDYQVMLNIGMLRGEIVSFF
jgi:hypothetical protein